MCVAIPSQTVASVEYLAVLYLCKPEELLWKMYPSKVDFINTLFHYCKIKSSRLRAVVQK